MKISALKLKGIHQLLGAGGTFDLYSITEVVPDIPEITLIDFEIVEAVKRRKQTVKIIGENKRILPASESDYREISEYYTNRGFDCTVTKHFNEGHKWVATLDWRTPKLAKSEVSPEMGVDDYPDEFFIVDGYFNAGNVPSFNHYYLERGLYDMACEVLKIGNHLKVTETNHAVIKTIDTFIDQANKRALNARRYMVNFRNLPKDEKLAS